MRETFGTLIKSFFRFIAGREPTLVAACERVCAISHKATETKIVESLCHNEVHAIIDATDPATLNGARDRTLFMLMYNTGGRVQELVDLMLDDLHLPAPSQALLTGKGRKQRIVPLWNQTVDTIRYYCELRDVARLDSQRLFLNARGSQSLVLASLTWSPNTRTSPPQAAPPFVTAPSRLTPSAIRLH